jgi:hypothetical protein
LLDVVVFCYFPITEKYKRRDEKNHLILPGVVTRGAGRGNATYCETIRLLISLKIETMPAKGGVKRQPVELMGLYEFFPLYGRRARRVSTLNNERITRKQ